MFTFSSEETMYNLIAKANKVLAKLDLGAIQVLNIAPRKEVDGADYMGTPRYRVVFDANLELPSSIVQIQGQKVVARLQSVDGMNMITRLTDDKDLDLTTYQDVDITCQHCGLKRNRKSSWVVLDSERGLIQVGDSCADVYFGIDVEALLNVINKVYSFLGSDDEEWGGGGRSPFSFSVFASVVTWKAMTSGFVTKKQAGEFGTSTADAADFLARPCSGSPKERAEHSKLQAEHRAWREVNFKDMVMFELALDWWMDRTGLTEFEHNCRVAILSQDPRFMGLAAFGIKLWIDATFAKAGDSPESAYVGEIKKRQDFDLKVSRLRSFDTAYGTTTVVIFEDAASNVLIWKASVDPKVTLGQTYKVKGTVTKHEEYKGIKQTTLSRCSIG